MREYWFKSLRGRMILTALIIVNIPLLIVGFVMKNSAEQSLLDEKKSKLAAIAILLDSRLGPGGFEEILIQHGALAQSRGEQIHILNQALIKTTDEFANSSLGLGVGFYSKELDAIVTYGPSQQFGYTVGLPIGEEHPGRKVMEYNEFRVESGSLVRGNVMNAMQPIYRQGKVIGYIWANELTDDIHAQLVALDKTIFLTIALGFIFTLGFIIFFTESIVNDVHIIIQGIRELRFDLSRPIKGLKGELGEIVKTINELANNLSNAKNLSENIMASMADGIVAVNNSSEITAFNRAAERITGFTSAEAIGRCYTDIIQIDTHSHSLLLDTLHTGIPHIGNNLNIYTKSGIAYISISSSVLQNNCGKILGAVIVLRDLTKQKSLEEQVKRADRLAALGELMAGVAHEIRNPLTSIKGFLQYFQSVDDEKERALYLPMMLREVDRMNRIIEGLLYFARPYPASVAPNDIKNILQETLILVQNRMVSLGITAKIDISQQVPLVEIDGEQFKQVFLNLLINAMQAIQKNGVIRVNAAYLNDTDEIEIVFADTGPGISHELKEKIFDPFYTTKQSGTGLGLSVVQRIISAQGGRITVEQNETGGALFRIVIPRLQKGEITDGEWKNLNS